VAAGAAGAAAVAERLRIVVALDTGSLVVPVIETAAGLAAGLNATLDALFVEDERLVRLAALPFAHELSFPSARIRRMESADLERALRAQIDQVRKLLAATATALDLPWQLNVLRGDVLQTAFGYATPADVLVLGRSLAATLGGPGGAAAGERFPTLRRRAVLLLFDGSVPSVQALAAAQGLAGVAALELVVLIPASGPEPFRRLREQAVAGAAGRQPQPSKYLMLPDAAAATIARAARAHGAGAVVWPASAGRDWQALAAVVEAVPCPVVMVG
jgi:predicted phosphoribosyltransferase